MPILRLYKLKSNTSTIVKKDGNFVKVVWANSMEGGLYDARWIISKSNKDNLIELSEIEVQQVTEKIKWFEKTRNEIR